MTDNYKQAQVIAAAKRLIESMGRDGALSHLDGEIDKYYASGHSQTVNWLSKIHHHISNFM